MKKLFIAVAAFFAFAVPGVADTLRVATGDIKLTYSRMFKEISDLCGTEVALVEMPTNGSISNTNMLINNEVNAGFTQTDILFYRARTENLDNIKTLLALHPEEVHVIGRNEVRKEGGVLGIGGKQFQITAVEHLAGRNVGAVGGSFITAQVIRLQSEIAFRVSEFPKMDAALAALKAGQIDAVISVAGAPADSIKALGREYRLLSFGEATVGKLKNVYRPARLTYPNLGANGVSTIATDALFVTREYKTAKFRTTLNTLRNCVLKNLDELKETTGTHPKWQVVDSNNKGKWQWYQLP